MKIVAGMNSIEDYIDFCKAGVDEVFCGYIPYWWYEIKGIHVPLNRREVNYYQVQLGSRSELKILSKMVQEYHVPVTITLNALSYEQEDYPLIKRMVEECKEDGFFHFIVADLGLLLKMQDIEDISIHLSGEVGEINRYALNYYKGLKIKRIIFHRKVSIEEMDDLICDQGEYEAFMLNEMCHFHGGYCNSIHSDEMCHMCLVEYKMEKAIKLESNEYEGIGKGGCGLCALYALQKIGITHLKIVSRGNYKEDTIADILALKKALAIAINSKSEKEYINTMKNVLFTNGCSMNCYFVKKIS